MGQSMQLPPIQALVANIHPSGNALSKSERPSAPAETTSENQYDLPPRRKAPLKMGMTFRRGRNEPSKSRWLSAAAETACQNADAFPPGRTTAAEIPKTFRAGGRRLAKRRRLPERSDATLLELEELRTASARGCPATRGQNH